MANPEHLAILKQGAEVWNRWREENSHIRPDLTEADLREAILLDANLKAANLNGTFLAGARLAGADLTRANLNKANFVSAGLQGTKLIEADVRDAHLSGTDLGGAILRGANLTGTNLLGADLGSTNLSTVDLVDAGLLRANLARADLTQANLSKANLSEANLHEANLKNANLSGVDISGANLTRVQLNEADLTQAKIAWTILIGTDLSTVKGLESVEHQGPSYIDIHTLFNSKGKIPNVFLRGVGAPDIFLEYLPSLTGKAIQYYSCFISYSNKDETFAQRLHADLQQKGVRCWFAPEDMKIGDRIRPTIDQSIRIHDKLLVILSKNSMQSDWVEDEVETAVEEEAKRKETVLFPIRLDEAVMETDQAWAAKLRRTRHIGDFSPWKDHDAYRQAFERLLRDLKAEV